MIDFEFATLGMYVYVHLEYTLYMERERERHTNTHAYIFSYLFIYTCTYMHVRLGKFVYCIHMYLRTNTRMKCQGKPHSSLASTPLGSSALAKAKLRKRVFCNVPFRPTVGPE